MIVHYGKARTEIERINIWTVFDFCGTRRDVYGNVFDAVTDDVEQVTCPGCRRRMSREVTWQLSGAQDGMPPGALNIIATPLAPPDTWEDATWVHDSVTPKRKT